MPKAKELGIIVGASICFLLITSMVMAALAFAETGSDKTKKENKQKQSLQDQLDKRKEEFSKSAPEEMKNDFEQGVIDVAESGALETALNVGDTAVMFKLQDIEGDTVDLKYMLDDGPVVLAWYRGGWCPYCNIELRAYQEALPQFKEYGATVIAISPEKPSKGLETSETHKLDFHVVSDLHNRIAHQYGIVYTLPDVVQKHFEGRLDLSEYNADHSNELPLTVTYVIDQEGIIRYAFIDPDYKKRAEPSEIIEVLRDLN